MVIKKFISTKIVKYGWFISLVGLMTLLNTPVFSVNVTKKIPSNPVTLFNQANIGYEKGEYEEAIHLYRELESSEYKSGNLYYNMGNSYLKLGKTGWAVLYYEKAKRLIPLDSDLKTNLTTALTKVNEGEVNWRDEFFRKFAFVAPLDQLAMYSAFIFLFLILWICIALIFPVKVRHPETGHFKFWWLLILFFWGILFISAASITTLTYLDREASQAVAIKSGAQARFEPNTNATISFPLAEGSRVNIDETKGEWSLITRRDRKRGWVENIYLGKI